MANEIVNPLLTCQVEAFPSEELGGEARSRYVKLSMATRMTGSVTLMLSLRLSAAGSDLKIIGVFM